MVGLREPYGFPRAVKDSMLAPKMRKAVGSVRLPNGLKGLWGFLDPQIAYTP